MRIFLIVALQVIADAEVGPFVARTWEVPETTVAPRQLWWSSIVSKVSSWFNKVKKVVKEKVADVFCPTIDQKSVWGFEPKIEDKPRIIAIHPKSGPNEVQVDGSLKLLNSNIFLRNMASIPGIPIGGFTTPEVRAFSEQQQLRWDLFVDWYLPEFDLVTLQEIFDPEELFTEMQNKVERTWHVVISAPGFRSGGKAILSPNRPTSVDSMVWTTTGFPNVVAMKGVLFAEIPKEQGRVLLFTTHLQSTHGKGWHKLTCTIEEYAEQRAAQLKQMTGWVAEKLRELNFDPALDRVLITGDYNIDGYTSEYDDLLSSFQAMARDHAVLGGKTFVDLATSTISGGPEETWGGIERLDYIFALVGTASEEYSDFQTLTLEPKAARPDLKYDALSDHRALSVVIKSPQEPVVV